jgi:hypothetical protein
MGKLLFPRGGIGKFRWIDDFFDLYASGWCDHGSNFWGGQLSRVMPERPFVVASFILHHKCGNCVGAGAIRIAALMLALITSNGANREPPAVEDRRQANSRSPF